MENTKSPFDLRDEILDKLQKSRNPAHKEQTLWETLEKGKKMNKRGQRRKAYYIYEGIVERFKRASPEMIPVKRVHMAGIFTSNHQNSGEETAPPGRTVRA